MAREAWWATVHAVSRSQTLLSTDIHTHKHTHTHAQSKEETIVKLTKIDFDDLCKKSVKYNFNTMSWG